MLKILRGPIASGKSTYTASHVELYEDTVSVSRDDVRFMLEKKYVDVDEDLVTTVEFAAVKAALLAGKDVISDNTALSPRHANRMAHLGYELGHEVVLVDHFKNVPLEECLRRNRNRDRVVPDAIVESFWKRAQKAYSLPEPPPLFAPYTGTEGKPHAVLCDLDGTAALNLGGRSPYDETRVDEDSPNMPVRAALWGLRGSLFNIVYVSARHEGCRQATTDWLNSHRFPAGPLYMRADGDSRKDWIVKNELFDNELAPRYDVKFAFDDRNQVVDAYRNRGIPVFQVAPGDF